MFNTVQELAIWCEKHVYMFMLNDEKDGVNEYALEFVNDEGFANYDLVYGNSFLECVKKAASILNYEKSKTS